MEHRDAVNMLRRGVLAKNGPQRWADLGCGTGTFTKALADLLPRESIITAMDRDAAALKEVPEQFGGARIVKHLGDFVHDAIPAMELEGILLANALHFVREQTGLISKLAEQLNPTGVFLLVEYDMDTPGPWVPYPLSFTTLADLFHGAGFPSVMRLAERPSAFGRARLYSAWAGRE